MGLAKPPLERSQLGIELLPESHRIEGRKSQSGWRRGTHCAEGTRTVAKFIKKFSAIVVSAIVGFGVAACGGPGNAPKQDQGLVGGAVIGGILGSQMGRGKGSVVGGVLGAVAGGVIGHEIGRSLDERDRRLARQAELDAFERGTSHQPVRWRNPDNGRYGEVVPGPSYRRGPQDCREYTHTVYIDGRPQAMRGTACRNPDGTWNNVG